MSIFLEFLKALFDLSLAMAFYILLGLLFAGILHVFVPQNFVTKHLGKSSISSVIKATIFGIPLPVCSCGVIPLASSIKKSGASSGATLSFLISTPITGVDSILATYGIFGFFFTIYRVISSIVIAIIAGILINIFDKKKPTFTKVAQKDNSFLLRSKQESDKSCCSSSGCCESKKSSKVGQILNYGFITLLGDIAKPLFWGLIVGALITVLIPKDLSSLIMEYSFISYIIVLLIAIPMYVCATASLPIAAALILSGVSIGSAFVFLSAGPATNSVTIGVVKKMLGDRALYIYLGVIAIFSMLFGLGIDYLFEASNIDAKSLIDIDESMGVIGYISAVILWGFLLYFIYKSYFIKEKSCCS